MRRPREKFEDSIIGDVRKARAALWAKYGNDPKRILRHFLEQQAREPDKVVNLRDRKRASPRG